MSTDQIVLLAVIGLRLGVPLLIPRFPLPAIIACLVIDAADQTIFQNLTNLNLDSYQGYDKALDVYYLAIAYLSTIRNWTEPFAFRTAQFLWYYRLTGVLLFEATNVRALLVIFPNTFEYFFIGYETVRLLWNPRRLDHRRVITLAAFIWIVIKLPQEWWLHIAQLDFTDFMKEDVFGVSKDTSWGDAISQNLWFVALMIVVVIAPVIVGRIVARRLPPADWAFSVDVDAHPPDTADPHRDSADNGRLVSWHMFEKFALVAMIITIFSLIMPGDNETTFLGIAIPVGVLLVSGSLFRRRLFANGRSWSTSFSEFIAMGVVNIGIAIAFVVVFASSDSKLEGGSVLFFLLLLTLITTLFDRYTLVAAERSASTTRAADASSVDGNDE
jgi:hypothetical protein